MSVLVLSHAAFAEEAGQFTPVWSGFYVGGNMGYAGGNSAPDESTYHVNGLVGTFANEWFNGESSKKGNSFTGGFQAGYNHQIGSSFVLGLEADFNFAKARSQYSATYAGSLFAEPSYEYNLEEELQTTSQIDWFGTIRPRLGFLPQERLMLYGTGGFAFAKVKSSGGYAWREHGFWWGGPEGDHFFDRSGGFKESSSDIRTGWTVGGGAEYALTEKFSLKGEYLFVNLGKKSHTSYGDAAAAQSVTWKDDVNFSTIRLGVNYKF